MKRFHIHCLLYDDYQYNKQLIIKPYDIHSDGKTALTADYTIDFELPASALNFEESNWMVYGVAGIGYISAPERATVDTSVAHGGKQSLKVFFLKSSAGPSQGGL